MAWCEWWITDDCCGVFCGFTTNLLLSYAAFVQTYFVLGPWWGYFHPITLCYLALTVMAALCHARTQFTNPGAVPLDNENLIDLENQNLMENSRTRRYCKTCQQYKPLEAHHCSTCHRCIIRMDHHCPWVNNCVAMFNQKYFVLFCFYTALCCLFCISSLITRFLICQSQRPGNTTSMNKHLDMEIEAQPPAEIESGDTEHAEMDEWCKGNGLDVMFCIINLFEGILFGLFTMIMSCDQISSIISNVTYIDTLTMNRKQLQKRKKQASSMDNLSFIFGEPFGLGWFLPKRLTPKIKENFKNLCMQF
mmetsp:Transcript_59305/g.94335  ORF Transcript_59305/g.94335 Transcript_59305/m.94335 type:complete len:306 (-) Transcript_59305:120-1037(-)